MSAPLVEPHSLAGLVSLRARVVAADLVRELAVMGLVGVVLLVGVALDVRDAWKRRRA